RGRSSAREHPEADRDEADGAGDVERARRQPGPEPRADEHRDGGRGHQRAGRGGQDAPAAERGVAGEEDRRELRLVAQLGQEHADEDRHVRFHGAKDSATAGSSSNDEDGGVHARPSAPATSLTKSDSVMMPTSRSPSVTGSALILWVSMICAASAAERLGSTRTTARVM